MLKAHLNKQNCKSKFSPKRKDIKSCLVSQDPTIMNLRFDSITIRSSIF